MPGASVGMSPGTGATVEPDGGRRGEHWGTKQHGSVGFATILHPGGSRAESYRTHLDLECSNLIYFIQKGGSIKDLICTFLKI